MSDTVTEYAADVSRWKLKVTKKRTYLYKFSRSGKTILPLKPKLRTTYFLIDRHNSGKQTKISGSEYKALIKLGIDQARAK